jgi:hypothetical protein
MALRTALKTAFQTLIEDRAALLNALDRSLGITVSGFGTGSITVTIRIGDSASDARAKTETVGPLALMVRMDQKQAFLDELATIIDEIAARRAQLKGA